MESNTDVCMKQRCVTEVLNAEDIVNIEIHKCVRNIYANMTVDVGTVIDDGLGVLVMVIVV
jgi:hypothetical protein